jgi:hypothetical protein
MKVQVFPPTDLPHLAAFDVHIGLLSFSLHRSFVSSGMLRMP